MNLPTTVDPDKQNKMGHVYCLFVYFSVHHKQLFFIRRNKIEVAQERHLNKVRLIDINTKMWENTNA